MLTGVPPTDMPVNAALWWWPGRSAYVVIAMGRGGPTAAAVTTATMASTGGVTALTTASLGQGAWRRREAELPALALSHEADESAEAPLAEEHRCQPSADEP